MQDMPTVGKTAGGNVLEQMRNLIRGKRLQPGMKLPPERTLLQS